ncbi:MAG TPA: hypothetical protein VNU69_08525, partial [Rhizomicrobium sp.]|nr:hypothetical protein [Rhizomicrobium sp.]
DFAGPRPRVSIWHGVLDTTVNINNAQASAAQWADVLGLALTDAKQEMIDGAIRLSWGDRLEIYTLPTLGHGTPIDSRDVGQAAPFILDVGISSSRRIAQFWGLVRQSVSRPVPKPVPKPMPVHIVTPPKPVLPQIEAVVAPSDMPQQPKTAESLIRRALKAVGFFKR